MQSFQTSKLIVIYSKKSLHFREDCGMFCEGEWEEQLMAEVNITSDELHSFLGADVSVTLHGDERDRPSIFGHVQLVTKTHIQLSPATIDGKETDVYQIEIRDIAKCTSMPDDWEQQEHGPKLYIKLDENVIKVVLKCCLYSLQDFE